MESSAHAILILIFLFPMLANGITRHYNFNVVMKTTSRLCSSKPIVTVNGQFPGPTLYATEGDNVLVNVVNKVKYNVTIHWHGVRQLRTGWADGPAYITQCPIQPGQSYVYNFTLTGQRGTLWYHAHILWLRATVHGAIVIKPKPNVPYPFPKPDKEVVVILGEWWKADTEAVINQAIKTGKAPNVSDAHTINGLPGPSSTCNSSKGDAFKLHVKPNKTYLLRIINAALNEDLFLKIARHNLTVVEVDASYTKPFSTDTLLLTPGQTTSALLSTTQPPSQYLLSASPFMDTLLIPIDPQPATALIHYPNSLSTTPTIIPPRNSTLLATSFSDSLRSLTPTHLPLSIHHSLLFTIGLGANPCPQCPNKTRLVGAVNNITFLMPSSTSLLQAHFFNLSGVFTADFPPKPEFAFNYTGSSGSGNLATMTGTRVYRVGYNETVQVVLQDTGIVAAESHPIHLHGFNFFVVGKGVGNYDAKVSPLGFNLVDPVERNTVAVPSGGWAALRFRADNPGVWFLHCHFEIHTSWGLKMAFVVDNGNGPNESILRPPSDLPKC